MHSVTVHKSSTLDFSSAQFLGKNLLVAPNEFQAEDWKHQHILPKVSIARLGS